MQPIFDLNLRTNIAIKNEFHTENEEKFHFLCGIEQKKPTSKMLVGYNTSSRPFLKTRSAHIIDQRLA